MNKISGYHGCVLDVNLTTGSVRKRQLKTGDCRDFIGGRGLGMKLLWDELTEPGIDPLSPKNPLLFMPGPFSGFPIPSASRTCVVTKSPITSPEKSRWSHASTVSYSNMGGFFGPEIRFAGYDGLLIRGKSQRPVYLVVDDDRVRIEDAGKYWGMGTDEFDKVFIRDLGDRRFRTCYIGPAGENQVPIACIINTAARAAGRGGTGCVMGAKRLKAIAVRGSHQPDVARHREFLKLLESARKDFKGTGFTEGWRRYGTGAALIASSDRGSQAVKNYREGTFLHVDKIGGIAARRRLWQRDFACFVCPLACKKSGVAPLGPYSGLVHDGPEYETGTMLGSNLLIKDLNGIQKAIYVADNLGLDIIAAGNTIGFLMEAYDKGMIDREFLDGIDLRWGDVAATVKMLEKIAHREGVGETAASGLKSLSEKIGSPSGSFCIHSKGHGLAAWNCHVRLSMALCYATSNRGACHLNGHSPSSQDRTALIDSTGLCLFARGGYRNDSLSRILEAITERGWLPEDYLQAGERVFNLEKCLNYREGFRRRDDRVADRFFEEPLSVGPKKGSVLDRKAYEELMNGYYEERGWDPRTTRPSNRILKKLGLDFLIGHVGT